MSSPGSSPTFRQRLLVGEQLIGTVVTLSDASVVEILAQAGFDWIWIDGEHSALNISSIQELAQAAGSCHCLVRVPSLDEAWIKKTLDTGVDGVIFPLVNNRAQAEKAVALSKYPPLGQRSVGLARAQGYGFRFQEYVLNANEWICTMIQIEHVQGVENLEEILKVPGIDAVLIGPYDLSASMGMPGQVDDPNIQSTIEFIRQTCTTAGIPVGIFVGNTSRALSAIAQGYRFIGVGVDVTLLSEAAVQSIKQLKPGS
jgi:2-dehydro-3-deoxyglucarate aldolase/4-hydroxy-2-oxoheptanedioate aldolase